MTLDPGFLTGIDEIDRGKLALELAKKDEPLFLRDFVVLDSRVGHHHPTEPIRTVLRVLVYATSS